MKRDVQDTISPATQQRPGKNDAQHQYLGIATHKIAARQKETTSEEKKILRQKYINLNRSATTLISSFLVSTSRN